MGDYIDGRLAPRELQRLEAHLAVCNHCSEYLDQLRVTINALGRADPQALSDEALSDLVSCQVDSSRNIG
jgi:anti-sigma factor RsiW